MTRDVTREQILEAYRVLDLMPGSPLSKVMDEWRFLAGKLHPDQARSESDRKRSEAKLKRLNHAKDILASHHKSQSHSASGPCLCRTTTENLKTSTKSAGASDETASSDGTATSHDTASSDGTAASHDTDSSHSADSSHGTVRTYDTADGRTSAGSASALRHALKQLAALMNPQHKRITLAITFLITAAILGLSVYQYFQWREEARRFNSRYHLPNIPSVRRVQQIQQIPKSPATNLAQPLTENDPAARNFQQQQQEQEALLNRKRREQEIYFQRMMIDKNEKIIAHCRSEIVQYQMKLVNPESTAQERETVAAWKRFQERNLATAKADLQQAQEALAKLGNCNRNGNGNDSIRASDSL